MLILGVDIAARKGGSNCGLALIDPRKFVLTLPGEPAGDLLWARSIDGTDLRAIAAVIAEVRDIGAMTLGGTPDNPQPEGILLAIERQFIGVDPSAAEKLIGARIRFETVAAIRSVPYEIVYPKTWQATMFALLGADTPLKVSKPPKPKTPKRPKNAPPQPAQQVLVAAPKMIPDTKASARLLCDRLYPGAELTKDECDAVLLARHVGWHRRPK